VISISVTKNAPVAVEDKLQALLNEDSVQSIR